MCACTVCLCEEDEQYRHTIMATSIMFYVHSCLNMDCRKKHSLFMLTSFQVIKYFLALPAFRH